MSRYIKFSREEKEQARTTDLAGFLAAQGENPIDWQIENI